MPTEDEILEAEESKKRELSEQWSKFNSLMNARGSDVMGAFDRIAVALIRERVSLPGQEDIEEFIKLLNEKHNSKEEINKILEILSVYNRVTSLRKDVYDLEDQRRIIYHQAGDLDKSMEISAQNDPFLERNIKAKAIADRLLANVLDISAKLGPASSEVEQKAIREMEAAKAAREKEEQERMEKEKALEEQRLKEDAEREAQLKAQKEAEDKKRQEQILEANRKAEEAMKLKPVQDEFTKDIDILTSEYKASNEAANAKRDSFKAAILNELKQMDLPLNSLYETAMDFIDKPNQASQEKVWAVLSKIKVNADDAASLEKCFKYFDDIKAVLELQAIAYRKMATIEEKNLSKLPANSEEWIKKEKECKEQFLKAEKCQELVKRLDNFKVGLKQVQSEIKQDEMKVQAKQITPEAAKDRRKASVESVIKDMCNKYSGDLSVEIQYQQHAKDRKGVKKLLFAHGGVDPKRQIQIDELQKMINMLKTYPTLESLANLSDKITELKKEVRDGKLGKSSLSKVLNALEKDVAATSQRLQNLDTGVARRQKMTGH